MNRLRARPFLTGFAAALVLLTVLVTIVLLVSGGSSKENPLAGPAIVLRPPKIRLPLTVSPITDGTEGLVTVEGDTLYYVGRDGRFAVHPLPILDADLRSIGLGSPATVRAVDQAPPRARVQGRYPDGILLVDTNGAVFIVWNGERRPVAVLLVGREELDRVPPRQTPPVLIAEFPAKVP